MTTVQQGLISFEEMRQHFADVFKAQGAKRSMELRYDDTVEEFTTGVIRKAVRRPAEGCSAEDMVDEILDFFFGTYGNDPGKYVVGKIKLGIANDTVVLRAHFLFEKGEEPKKKRKAPPEFKDPGGAWQPGK